MEQSEAFNKADATIKALERKLATCNFNEVWLSAQAAEREIEEYFAKILNLLAARKATLLASVLQQLNQQMKSIGDTRGKLEQSLEAFKQTMKSAAQIYSLNSSVSESMHKNISNTPIPNVFEARISVALSPAIFETIQNLVNISDRFSVANIVSTLAGSTQGKTDGKAQYAQFNHPYAICHSPYDDCFYVCDFGGSSIRKITLQGDVSTFVANCELVTTAIAMYYKEKYFVVCEYTTHSIYKITQSGTVSLIAGSGQSGHHGYKDGTGTNARFHHPSGIAVDQQTGSIYVSDFSNCVIRKITPQGEVSTLAGLQGAGYADGTGSSAKFSGPFGICFDEKSTSLLVCDYHNHKLRRVMLNGAVITLCNILQPTGVALTANSTIMVSQNHKISKIINTGQQYKAVKLAGTEQAGKVDGTPAKSAFHYPWGIAVHEPSHSCYIVEYGSHSVRKISFATSM